MTRRYIDRKTKDHYKKLVRYDDERKYITETGPKIPEFEEALNAKRIIFLKDSSSHTQSASEIVNERIGELLNAAEETSEYIQHVNTHLERQKLKVNDLKKLQKIFEKQVSMLETNDEKEPQSK